MKNELSAWLAGAKTVEWRLEKSTSETIVFYQLSEGPEAFERLRERLQKFPTPKVLVLNRAPLHSLGVETLIVPAADWMSAQAQACDQFFPLPKKIKLLAVTGTNGKTTTVDLVLQLGQMGGLKGFSVGTLGVRTEGATREEFGLTTPGYIQLRSILHHYGSDADFCVMEASSHAIDQDRLHGLSYAAAAWTSFSQDHLDYHKTMDAYFAAKSGILRYLAPGAKFFVPHQQTEILQKLSPRATPTREILAKSELSAFFAAKFNLENLECARDLISCLGVSDEKIRWSDLKSPPGRFYVQEFSGRMAVVDFAHTPDAVENICRSIKESFPGKRLVVLFGCGGDRDRTKRPLMGQAAARYADRIILTSDNPRSEKPEQIIQDIATGIPNFQPLTLEADRPKAVQDALKALQQGEILLMAGKGHEDYILIGQTKIPYSDVGEIEKFLRKNHHG